MPGDQHCPQQGASEQQRDCHCAGGWGGGCLPAPLLSFPQETPQSQTRRRDCPRVSGHRSASPQHLLATKMWVYLGIHLFICLLLGTPEGDAHSNSLLSLVQSFYPCTFQSSHSSSLPLVNWVLLGQHKLLFIISLLVYFNYVGYTRLSERASKTQEINFQSYECLCSRIKVRVCRLNFFLHTVKQTFVYLVL